jgi:autotransporter strand-loop-strand O-heptosyltransferase
MKITQVTPGLIPIPPNGWGAVEKIIWEYKLKLDDLGVPTDIKYLNEVQVDNTDIVHIHIANLAIEAKNKGIPYIFSLHDHHVVHNGRGSINYNQNLEAIKGSVISFCHAEYLVNYFEETDKLFYLSHGVDTNFFRNDTPIKNAHKLLCIANNGLAGNSSFDRKGFRYAIEAAIKLSLPITVAGPENNRHFFEENSDLLKYEKLNVIYNNPNETDIRELYNTHSIFLHPSSLEAGHPNLTLLEALSSGLPVVGTYEGTQDLNGMVRVSRDTDEVVNGIQKIIDDYPRYVEETKKIREKYDWKIIVKRMLKMYEAVGLISKPYTSEDTKNLYIKEYTKEETETIIPIKVDPRLSFNVNFVDGPYFEMIGNTDSVYTLNFYNGDSLYYTSQITKNTWTRLNTKYFIPWKIELIDDVGDKVYEHKLSFKNKRVYIAFDSSSLGDNIAWIPYVEEFRKTHECDVICSTFKNDLFVNEYPNIKFVSPGTVVENLHGMYKIGWFYDKFKEPELPNTIPLQKTITNILGLPFKEIKPNITFTPSKRPIESKYVVIANESTAGLKYWSHPNGWKELVSHLKRLGYSVINISKNGEDVFGAGKLSDTSLENTMNYIYHSEFFIGLSSGLSWLSWGIGKHVVMISNFTEPDHEFTTNCTRITNPSSCNGCWNNPMFKFDKGDWDWCPEHKGTERQFECHKSITPQMVINQITHLLK